MVAFGIGEELVALVTSPSREASWLRLLGNAVVSCAVWAKPVTAIATTDRSRAYLLCDDPIEWKTLRNIGMVHNFSGQKVVILHQSLDRFLGQGTNSTRRHMVSNRERNQGHKMDW